MQPTFNNCTLLLTDYKINPFLINNGGIVLVDISSIQTKFNLTKIAHRVIENDEMNGKISTRGDNDLIYEYPEQIDGWFDYDRILGEVKYHLNIPEYFCRNGKN